jgi:hypothetical protein
VEGSADHLYRMAVVKGMMRPYSFAIRPGLLAFAAWLPVVLPSASTLEWLPPNRYELSVPRVCVPYSPGTDVVSLVPDLFSALTIAVLCLLLVEVAKVMVAALPRRQTLRYVAFAVYQATLMVDVLRHYAWDWYGYLLYFSRLITLSHNHPRPEILPLPSPWLSFLPLLLCLGLCGYARSLPPEQDPVER